MGNLVAVDVPSAGESVTEAEVGAIFKQVGDTVSVDEPKKGYYGGSTAAPLFSEITRFTLGHRRVPPNDPDALDPAEPDA